MTKNKTKNIDNLKEELKGWKKSLMIRSVKRKGLIIEYKKQELYLKKIRSCIYQSEKEIKEAKKQINYYKLKISRVPREVREWNKKNLDKVFESMERNSRCGGAL